MKNNSLSNGFEKPSRVAVSCTLGLKPEWIRVPEAVRVSGMSRSSLYELIASGKIKSFSNRQRGAIRGIRLISYDSLMGYLELAYQQSEQTEEADR